MAEHNDLGKWGEDEAVLYLEDEGYAILERDWKIGRRDLDIVAVSPDGATLVIVEVKTRSDEEYLLLMSRSAISTRSCVSTSSP